MLAEPIRAHLARRSHPTALGIPDPRCNCCALYRSHRPQRNPRLLSFGLSNSPFQFSQSSVSEMLSGALSSSLLTGWCLILRTQRTFKIWVCPPGRSFANKAGGKGDLSDNLNAAAPSCCKSDQDALTISSVSEMYPTAVICLFWARNSFCVARGV